MPKKCLEPSITIKSIFTAKDNRYKCSNCKGKIFKGQKYYRDAFYCFRASHTTNLCRDCISLISAELGLTTQEIQQAVKKLMLDKLEGKKLLMKDGKINL